MATYSLQRSKSVDGLHRHVPVLSPRDHNEGNQSILDNIAEIHRIRERPRWSRVVVRFRGRPYLEPRGALVHSAHPSLDRFAVPRPWLDKRQIRKGWKLVVDLWDVEARCVLSLGRWSDGLWLDASRKHMRITCHGCHMRYGELTCASGILSLEVLLQIYRGLCSKRFGYPLWPWRLRRI